MQFTLNYIQNKPAAIDGAVTQIKAQLEELREKLKNENGDKDDVIERLTDLKEKGLVNGDWPVNGQTLSGLGKIQEDLKEQNEQLGKQTKIIGDNMTILVRKIKLELAKIGYKLENLNTEEDVMDNLKKLKEKIGQGVLQGTKGSDVITTLNDLKNGGLSGDKWDKHNKNKSLKNIESELNTQQTTLNGQPKNIEDGVQSITGELERLRVTLNTDVTKKLQKLKEHGLNEGKESWTHEGNPDKGLTKITADIATIKTENVDQVKEKLKELCTAIRTEANELSRDLKRMKSDSLDELTGIKENLRKLQIRLERGPIKACKEFIDREADKFGRECIAFLTAFVNGQVDTAIEDLTAFARQQCASNIKELLKLFAHKVEEELNPLPPLINGDLQIGEKGVNINRLKDVKSRELQALSSAFQNFFAPLDEHLREEIERVKKQSDDEKNPSLPKSEEPYAAEWDAVHSDVNALLNYLCVTQGFDHRLTELLRNLTDALSELKPESFARPSSPLLDGLAEGLTKFVAEFTCAYVSAYSGAQFTADLLKHETLTETVRSQGTKSVTVRNVSSLTPYGAMCAKVFLTLLPTLCDAFTRLAEQCGKGGKWRDLSINSSSELGTFLQRSGYKVSTSPFDQDGELRDECNGRDVYVLVTQNIKETHDNEHLKKCLSSNASARTSLSTTGRATSRCIPHPGRRSVYEMLTWCCGSRTTPCTWPQLRSAAIALRGGRAGPADSDVPLMNLGSLRLRAHTQHITVAGLTDALTEVCHKAHSVLTTLLGHGHAGGIYACDFNTNPAGLLYPGDADALLCLLYDVLKRLHQQLYLLYRRCLYNARHGGWLDCWYGRGVGGSSWRCNTMQCANQICDQQCNQTHNQICNQRCDQHPKCGLKSPLQSFLEDGLVGFLPHNLSPKDTCVSCSGCDTKSPGLPCKTPMGLSNITRLASRASTGRHIMDVLGAFCGGASSPLTRLCGFLNCLLTRPPRTPDDLFAFYFNFISEWHTSGEHRKAAFEGAVGTACFWQRGVTLDVSRVFRTSDHGTATNMPHLTGDLFSLVQCNGTPGSAPSHPCGPYLKPLGHDVRATFAKEHAHLYLSWVVYLTETFYDILCALLQDCERTCADATSNCHANSCADHCPAKRLPMAPSSNHTADCLSIADCDCTTPTLFRYGFVHRDVHSLAGSTSGHPAKRTCQDLCTALQVAVKQMNPLHRLAHETIPEYLYRIPDLGCNLAPNSPTSLVSPLQRRCCVTLPLACRLGHPPHRPAASIPGLSVYHDVHEVAVICDHIGAITSAKYTLLQQVTKLGTWITDAERIRAAAEDKAREAYDKLKVNETLDENVKKIVKAKGEIEKVHKSLGTHLGSLNSWNQQAKDVLQGAIDNARYVYDRLEDKSSTHQIGIQLGEIHKNNESIKQANKDLKSEVTALGKWRAAAQNVITKAEGKCDEILKKVKTADKSGQKGPIYEQAETLKEQGNTLFNAAKSAKTAVESQVSEALQAVATMDESLKKDLKTVKNEIMKGVKKVIEELKVNDLDKKVKDDLKTLRRKISDLGKNIQRDNSDPLVKDALAKLAEEKKNKLDDLTGQDPSKSIVKLTEGLGEKFNSAIQHPLSQKVREVNEAIGTLGGTFDSNGTLKTFDKIFDHIKGQVGKIKGTPGTDWENKNGSGLLGIKSKVDFYFKAFSGNWAFNQIVKGWLEDVLKHNGAVRMMVGRKGLYDDGEKSNMENVANAFKEQLKIQADAAGEKVQKTNDSGGDIAKSIKAVKQGCETFAEALDEKLRSNGFSGIFDAVKRKMQNNKFNANKCICESVGCTTCNGGRNSHGTDCKEKAFLAAVLCTLAAVARQVGNELNSVFLSPDGANIASILDTITQTANKLDTALGDATKNSGGESPAQAVDSKLAVVRNFVNGKTGDENITSKFNKEVKGPLKAQVDRLPDAVTAFNTEAQTQVKAAAQTAITAAAGQISDKSSGPIELGGANKLMEGFKTAHDNIQENLEKNLKGKVDAELPDDKPVGSTGTVVQPDKITITKDNFKDYNSHVEQDSIKGYETNNPDTLKGQLPEKIKSISKEGLKSLTDVIDDKVQGDQKIDNTTFENPVKAISKDLDEIAWLVDRSRGKAPSLPQPQPKDEDGIKDHLTKLKNALEQTGFNGVDKQGLDATKTAIEGLHNGKFKDQPEAIEKAVQEIRTQLNELRGKLKNENGEDVMKTLEELQTKGLEKNSWEPNGKGQSFSGLGKIESDLSTEIQKLKPETEKIKNAIIDINWELGKIGFSLQGLFTTNDVIDKLVWLGNKIGKSGIKAKDNLHDIYDKIKQLQKEQFTDNPTTIENAKQQIVNELNRLQTELQDAKGNDVIATLNDLKGVGLSGDKWDKNAAGKNKSLKNIEDELGRQQKTLNDQPPQITAGVQDITGELTRLRNEVLQKEVINKLNTLKTDGLGSKQNWDIDEHSAKGLTTITADIEAIKSKDVDQVKEKLKELCTEIRHIAKDAAFTLKEVKEKSLNELTKIKDKFSDLLSEQVRGVIRELKGFLKFLDNGKAQLIKYLTQFVDKEIKEAEEILIKEVRRQCVSNIKEALEAFARKVEEELRELPWEIDSDLRLEYKGLMARVEDGLENDLNVQKLKESKSLPPLSSAFMRFYSSLEDHVDREINRFHDEEQRKKNLKRQDTQEYSTRLSVVNEAFHTVLTYLKDNDIFDHRLLALLRSLTDALSHLKPESFARPSTPLLDGLVEGLTKFAAEFTCAYVSAYAGQTFTAALVENETLTETVRSQGTKSVTAKNVTKLTPYGAMCAKVFLTMVPTLCDAFTRLAEQCGKDGRWRDLQIDSSSKLGAFLQRCGYKVSTSATLQDGELRDDCNGHDVYVLVSQKIEETEDNAHLKKCLSLQHGCNLLELLKCLCTHLQQYYRTCHLKVHPSPRPPCSVYEMLTWCCGLPYNSVYLGVTHEALPSLFEADEQSSRDSEVALTDLSSLALKAHPQHITLTSLTDALTDVCHTSHSVLTTLLGYGYAGGIYAVDFNTNPAGLLYPCDADALLCLLFDVLRRLHHQLYFLYRRCLYNARHGGWLDCWYGRDVGGSSWKCNTMQCANQQCPHEASQTGEQTHNQTCNQNCDQHPKCGVKSPLQSFLEDGLVGFLPHDVSADGTCVTCSGCDTKSPGLPCKTPMGLTNITRLASRALSGRHIMDVLGAFCGGKSSPLTRLCSYLECLFTRPPRTPDELFAFYYNFICEWSGSGEHRREAFDDAVGDACFWQRGVTLDVSTIFGTSDHGSVTNIPHLTGDLFSLVECNGSPGSAPSLPCGPYLKPLGHDVRATFAREHAHLYLSWIVYLTETFYDFLCALLQDCERNCADATSNCHARSCDNDCTAKRRPLAPSSNHTADCPSIVDCDSTTPTLFQYGFVLKDVHSLAGSTSGHQSKRTCDDFCMALQVAVKQMNPLHRLAHDTIPEFLYRIRAPFLYTALTLWLTATLYILHSLLYRMDVLRIRSHLLTTRASHLIDVKALLAGSRRMLSLYKDPTAVVPGLAVDHGGPKGAVICYHIGAIDTPNNILLQQVTKLGTWITSAEDIRQAAEDKAKEAYEKLDVNETLDENVKKIVDANKVIKGVHEKLNGVHGNLGAWKTQAGKVLQGAIGNAEEVYNKLQDDQTVMTKIGEIDSARKQIEKANSELGKEVDNIGKWKSAAQGVIAKAEEKCEEILGKVKTDKGSPGPIYTQAETLKATGIKLLDAATKAKKSVEDNVNSALEAVVRMDQSLKMDLKSVKDKIKGGIDGVIKTLEVNELDKKVMKDLGTLRENIGKLKDGIDTEPIKNILVSGALSNLKEQKTKLDALAGKDGKIEQETNNLERHFKTHIQSKLQTAVSEVDSAIEALGGKFPNGGKLDSIEQIFKHIKEKVGEIKGSERDQKGLDGIVAKVKALANAFVKGSGSNSGFDARVGGWLEGILGMGRNNQGKGMKAVTTWIGTYNRNLSAVGRNEGDLKVQVKNNIMPQLNSQIAEAQKQIAKVVDGKVVDNLTAIVSACNTFVDKLDAELTNDKIDHLANKIVPSIKGWMNGQNVRNFADDQALRSAVKYSLVALCGGVKQVATEIKSLGTGRFGEILDKIKPTVDELYNNLTEATKTGKPPDPADGTAQAVDKKLADVNTFVNGKNGDDNITSKFKSNVIHGLQQKVQKLPTAVNKFDTEAQAQIRNAAQKAIKQAAGKISEDGDITLGPDLMKDFEEAHGR
ncbi:hypothetical protein, conserved [Babesia ovata]|uniref:Extracellular matrix-binding ebh n=1 Tax=Babesia ovata TaxID=189622 RepID=A0A2H6KIT7_9APIC|nr:uncharacterized protein BOVATA_043910 [Babesia ovata]GBE62898.1 hypothetical protein, conserved [Babesia ovata]